MLSKVSDKAKITGKIAGSFLIQSVKKNSKVNNEIIQTANTESQAIQSVKKFFMVSPS
jgi:hypothetical protein